MNYTIPIGINVDAWDEWCEYRKATRKAVSSFAAKKQFKLLLNYSEDDQQLIIDHSIANDYQGLFPLKPQQPVAVQSPFKALTDDSWAIGLTDENLLN